MIARRSTFAKLFSLPLVLMGAAVAEAHAKTAASKTPSTADLAARLDVLESKQQITEVLHAYARADDRFDEELLRSCFWPESTHKHGGFDGTSSDFVVFSLNIIRPLKQTAHHISNVSIEVRGDRAVSECYYFARHHRTSGAGPGEEDAFFDGRYLDKFERRNGVWKIIHRQGYGDYVGVVPGGKIFADLPAGQHSLRKPDDPIYAFLAELRSGD